MSLFGGQKAGQLYRLEKEMPDLEVGTIFQLREHTEERGSIGCGFMTNIWVNGNTQSGWVAETHMVPGKLAENREWFTPIEQIEDQPKDIFEVNGKRFRVIKNG